MTADELLPSLNGRKEEFETSLGRVPSIDEPRELIVLYLRALDRDTLLDNSERERRLAAVFSRVTLSSADKTVVAIEGAKVEKLVLRNRLAQLLPAEHRVLLYSARDDAADNTVQFIVESPQPPPDQAASESAIPSQGEVGSSDVILLSAIDDPASQHLLANADFVPLRCQSMQELDRMLETNTEICAFLIDGSFLSALDRTAQNGLLRKLARFSTFVWLRVNEQNLRLSNPELGECIRTARCGTGQPDHLELSIRPDSVLQEREIENLRVARERLKNGHEHGLFTPGELDSGELNLLGAAMSLYSKRRRFNPGAQLTKVTTRFLQGGQTGARVALVRVNDLQIPVIAKLDQKHLILDEARRFLTFIHKDNLELNPEVYFHSRAAMILFGLIPGAQPGDEPAPTLEQRLSEFWYSEMRNPATAGDGDTLHSAFLEVLGRFKQLNTQKCQDTSFECKANPYLDSVLNMEANGFDWGLGADKKTIRNQALELFAAARHSAVCHGDAHTRNILIRAAGGSLIDYAYSGPGHPCSDLVRLELSIFFSHFVQLGSEAQLTQLQRDLTISRLGFEELIAQHEILIKSKTDRLVLRLCVAARDSLGDVLTAHNLPWTHYVATKVLSAWQALQVPRLQQALVRSVIMASNSLA